MKKQTLKPFPTFNSDEEVENFIDNEDLSEYDFSSFKKVNLESYLSKFLIEAPLLSQTKQPTFEKTNH